VPATIGNRVSRSGGVRGRAGTEESRGTETMRAISKRLDRLEKRWGPAVESWETRHLQMRLQAARSRCGLPSISTERRAGLRGMSVTAILNSSRAAAQAESPALSKRSMIF
jgi:hypothetical protein